MQERRLSEKESATASVKDKPSSKKGGSRTSSRVGSKKSGQMSEKSYHSMTYSEKMLAQKIGEAQQEAQTLPEIDGHSSRPMSAKRSRLSQHPSQASESGKKGPIKAFEDPLDQVRQSFQQVQKSGHRTSYDRFDSKEDMFQPGLKTTAPLEPLPELNRNIEGRQSSSSHHRSSEQKLLEIEGVKRQNTGRQEETKRSKITDEQAVIDLQVQRVDKMPVEQVINMDLDKVTLNEDINMTAVSGISQHDHVATEQTSAKRRNQHQQERTSQMSQKPKVNSLIVESNSTSNQGRSNSRQGQKRQQPKGPKRVNYFKEKKMTSTEIIDYLLEVGAVSVQLNMDLKPDDLDSTQAIDSFLDAFVAAYSWTNKKETRKLLETIHLSTGTRTAFCNEVLQYVIRQQIKETQFIDAVEFFQESLEHMVKIEAENEERKALIETLTEEKQTQTMKVFDLQTKLRETSSSLLKLRQREYEQSQQFAAMKQQLDAKKAECESLHYRLKHLGHGTETENVEEPGLIQQMEYKLEEDEKESRSRLSQASKASTDRKDKNIGESQGVAVDGDGRGSQMSMVSKGESLDSTKEPSKVQQIADTLIEQVQDFKHQQMIQEANKDEEQFEGNCGNFQSVQNMLNKVEITNKSLKQENDTIRAQLESKERLVAHLENKVTQIMVENEDNIVRLKSEIVLLKGQIEQSEQVNRKKMEQLKKDTQEDFQQKNSAENDSLKENNAILMRESGLQKERIAKLSAEYGNLQNEFQRFRKESADQEKQRDVYVNEIEGKLTSLSKIHVETKSHNNEKIAHLENQAELKHKENQMLYLRLKYMRQIADVLLRQKSFLSETLEKSKKELEVKMSQLESGMLSQNKNKSYLVSVEKAVKQSRNVADISKSALSNIQQIVKFFKIEKIHQLVFATEEPADLNLNHSVSARSRLGLGREDSGNSVHSKRGNTLEQEESDELGANSEEEVAYNVEKTEVMLNSLKACIDLPVNFKPRIFDQPQVKSRSAAQKVVKNEEYFLENCSVELVSVLLKYVVELLTKVDAVTAVEQIPHSISRLLYLSNNKSDLQTERELFELFLAESNKVMVDELRNLSTQLDTHARMKELFGSFSALPHGDLNAGPGAIRETETYAQDAPSSGGARTIQVGLEKSDSLTPASSAQAKVPAAQKTVSASPARQTQKDSQKRNTGRQEQSPGRADELEASSADRRPAMPEDNLARQELENDVQLLQIQLEQQKERSMLLQKGLAEKVIKLEETVDYIKEDYEERLSEAELSYRQELEQIHIGAQQREKQLLLQIEQLSDRNAQLEVAHDGLDSVGRDGARFLRNSSKMSSKESLGRFMPPAKDGRPGSVQSLLAEADNAQAPALLELQEQFATFQENLEQFVSIRESTHGTISLVFEASDSNLSMVNEQMLGFYLAKVFELPKEKFRFLARQEIVEEAERRKAEAAWEKKKTVHKPEAPVAMIKVVVEIVEDQQTIQKDLLRVKTAVRDGSSLLYDLLPSYMSINMGHSGLATRTKLSECHLVSKQGREIGGTDFVVSLLRSTKSPYCFLVTLLDLVNGEEYCLELLDQDIFQLTEGDQGILERSEPQVLADLIIENLELLDRDGVKFLTCEHKVFFNGLWQEFMSSALSSSNQLIPQGPIQQVHDLRYREAEVKDTEFARSTFRDRQLNADGPENRFDQQNHYAALLKSEAGCQTDFEGSVFYDSQVPVYQGSQRLNGDVKIDMRVHQSQNENLLTLVFEETKSLNSVRFSVFNKLSASGPLPTGTGTHDSRGEDDSADGGFEHRVSAAGGGKQPKSQYLLHSECIQVRQEHLVLVCVERIQNDGLLVKLHDLKLMTSDEFYLVRKSNGHLTRLNTNQNLALTYKEDFRNLVFDLSFTQQAQSQDIVLSNLAYAQEKMQALGQNPSRVSQELFAHQKAQDNSRVRKIHGFTAEAFLRTPTSVEDQARLDEWKTLQERGLLLYRDCIVVRCNFENDEQLGEDTEQQSLISLYLKDDQVNIEVFLYNDTQKMSITSNVSAIELFGREPTDIPFNERITLLSTMLEKLFVLQEDNRFHMKVEGEAEPISQLLAKREKAASQMSTAEHAGSTAVKRKGITEQQYEDRVREFQLEKDSLVQNHKARFFSRWITSGGQNFDVKIYVTMRSRRPTMKSIKTRGPNVVGKTQQQIEQQKCETFMDENAEFDQIYVETMSQADDLIYALIEKRTLAKILTKDVTCQWQQLITTWVHDLVNYFFEHVSVDVHEKKLDFYNRTDITELLVTQCRTVSGGQILRRDRNLMVDGFGEESAELLRKTIVLNQEIDFTEFSYDIKLFKISRKSPFGDGQLDIGSETLAYHLEIFNVNQPDVIYKYRLPVQQNAENDVHDPMTFVVDVFNLIDHPLKEIEEKERAEKEKAAKAARPAFNRQVTTKLPKKEKPKAAADADQTATSGQEVGTSGAGQLASQEGAIVSNVDSIDSPKGGAAGAGGMTPAQAAAEAMASDNSVREHSIKYQVLFKKYIDNQLLLVIQESKFPAAINFTLVEPSSRLLWKCAYEPQTEIVSPSHFSIIDPGSVENFLTLVYDAMETAQMQPRLTTAMRNESSLTQSPKRQDSVTLRTAHAKSVTSHGNWHQMLERVPPTYLAEHEINDRLKIAISKEKGKLRIQLSDPSLIEEPDNRYSTSQLGPRQQASDKPPHHAVGSAPGAEMASANAVFLEPIRGLDVRLQRNRGVYLLAKVLNMDDAKYEESIGRSVVLLVNVSLDDFTVHVVDLHSLELLFEYQFTHSHPVEDDIYITPATEVNAIYRVADVRPFVMEAIKHLNSVHVQEQVVCNHQRLMNLKGKTTPAPIRDSLEGCAWNADDAEETRVFTFEDVLFNLRKCISSESRFYQRNLKNEKVVTLHRKIFYDEVMEKLIIITANISYTQGKQRLDNPMLLEEEAAQFQFKILEPENNMVTVLDVPFETCFNERQLASLNRRDMMKLKNLARVILEDRAVIKRQEMQPEDKCQAYTLDIIPQVQQAYSGMVDDGNDSIGGSGGMGVEPMDGDTGLPVHHGNQAPGGYRDGADGQHHHAEESENAAVHRPGGEMGGGMDENGNQRLSGGEQQLQVDEMSQSQGRPLNSVIVEEASQEDKEMDLESSQQPAQAQGRADSRKLTTGQGSRGGRGTAQSRPGGNSSQKNLSGSNSLQGALQDTNKRGSVQDLPNAHHSSGEGLN